MEVKKLRTLALGTMVLLIWWLMTSPAIACSSDSYGCESHSPPACTSDGSGCKACILDQMKYGCPTCVPLIRCMARCLWSGNSRSMCVSQCDCNGGKPKLSDCKKCMSRCKCSCVA